MTWIKICGTTNLDDAQAAVTAGADALGFIFAPSPRRISPADAASIIAELPPRVEKVGVFVGESAERIREIVNQAGLTAVQLYGEHNREFAAAFAAGQNGFRIIPAVSAARILELITSSGMFSDFAGGINTVLVDSMGKANQGGTGKTWDWSAAKRLHEAARQNIRVIVAGGLTAANVGEAIATLRPWGVDVCSGVERGPGRKDPDKLHRFVSAVRAAEKRS